MGRPETPRRVGPPPPHGTFKPAGVERQHLSWVTLALDELEAMRLVDHDGLDQEAAAAVMGVSRQTVSRLLMRARKTLTQALVQGLGVRIQGGKVIPCQHREGREGKGHRGGSCCGSKAHDSGCGGSCNHSHPVTPTERPGEDAS